MAFTQTDIDTLESAIRDAIAKGYWLAKTIQFSDQVVQLGSLKDAMDLLADLKRQVAGGSVTRYAAVKRGL